MKLAALIVAASISANAFADTTMDTPVPTSCTYKRDNSKSVTIDGGTRERCEAAALADASRLATVGTATYTFNDVRSAQITYTADAFVCPLAPPPDTTQQAVCQAPLFGTFTQTQGWTLHESPTCWVNDGPISPTMGSVPPCSTTLAAVSYTTTFPLTEDPISESGHWIGGKTVGLKWSDFKSMSGLAIGKQGGLTQAVYDDAIALLTGVWGPNQTAEASVKTINQDDNIFEELEIHLRSTLTANNSTGYECNFSARSNAKAYVQIVRWNGALGDFHAIDGREGSAYALHDGDTIKCSINGSTITAYINGVQKLQVNDTTFKTGNPGIGAFLKNGAGVNSYYGFTSFTATTD